MNDVETASLLLRTSVGFVMIIFGISQMKHPEKWLAYIPGFFKFIMPIKPTNFMRVHSLGNLGLGALLISTLVQPVSLWLALLWWLWILPFAFYYEFTVGLRDFAIIIAIVALLVLG